MSVDPRDIFPRHPSEVISILDHACDKKVTIQKQITALHNLMVKIYSFTLDKLCLVKVTAMTNAYN